MTLLARVENLSFRYADAERWALRDVNLDINAGEVVVLAGQSGCGKSTLLRCVNGLIPHMYPGEYSGDVTISGDEVASTAMGLLAQKVGLLFQNPENQIFMFSVERDIAFGLENLGLPRPELRTRVDEAMRLLGISQLALRAPHELSDGQKQRVALAGVIAMRPRLIILDEPTSLLDPETASDLVSLVNRLNKEEGITFVIVEHRLELLVPIADRIIVMDRGRIEMDGRTADVLDDPRCVRAGNIHPPSLPALRAVEEARRRPAKAAHEPGGARQGAERALTLIEVKGVSFTHQNGVKALDGVSLSVGRGEFVAIVGENGAGKTTLVKHLNGLLKPATGSVTVDGQDTRSVSTAQLARKVGIAFQNPDHQLFSDTVENELSFALRNFGFDEVRIEERLTWALEFFSLQQYRRSSPLILSGGEKKRLTLASILAWDPDVVVLDEPTVGQDAIQKEKLTSIIETLKSTGKTIIVVSHDVEFLWSMQPRLVVMKQGRIVEDGPSSRVMLDRELLAGARVSQPQLVRLYAALSTKPERAFIDVKEAEAWLSREAT